MLLLQPTKNFFLLWTTSLKNIKKGGNGDGGHVDDECCVGNGE
jgi:hypothetical protein